MTYWLITGAALLWCASFTLQPLLMQGGPALQKTGTLIYIGFSPICHQNTDRSLTFFSRPMAVCSRCAGIYYGALIQILLYPWIGARCRQVIRTVKWLGLAAVPLLLDFILTYAGFIPPWGLIRVFTGGILGWVTLCYILPGACEWLTKNTVNL